MIDTYLNLAKGVPCIAEPNSFSIALTGDTMEVRRHYTCPRKIEALSTVYGLFFNEDPAARAIITADGPAGKREALVDLKSRNVNLSLVGDAGTATRPSFLSLVLLGVEHIVTGVDHVMFLLALLLGLPRLHCDSESSPVNVSQFKPGLSKWSANGGSTGTSVSKERKSIPLASVRGFHAASRLTTWK